MSKVLIGIAIALSLAVEMHGTYAQTSSSPATTAATQHKQIQTDEIRASKMIGSAVYDVQNRKIGSVDDVILNKNGKVDAIVIDVGSFLGMGGKDIAVLPSDIKTDNNRLALDRTKEQLQQMGSYNVDNRNTGAGSSSSPVTDLPGGVTTPAPPPTKR